MKRVVVQQQEAAKLQGTMVVVDPPEAEDLSKNSAKSLTMRLGLKSHLTLQMSFVPPISKKSLFGEMTGTGDFLHQLKIYSLIPNCTTYWKVKMLTRQDFCIQRMLCKIGMTSNTLVQLMKMVNL